MENAALEQPKALTLDSLELQFARNLKSIDAIFSILVHEIALLHKKLEEKTLPTKAE